MKTRQGFVSNSSSSSYVFLGVSVNKYPEILTALGFQGGEDDPYYEEHNLKEDGFEIYGNGVLKKDGLMLAGSAYLPYDVGIDPTEELEKGISLPEIREMLRLKFEQLGVKVDIEDICFDAIETNSEY